MKLGESYWFCRDRSMFDQMIHSFLRPSIDILGEFLDCAAPRSFETMRLARAAVSLIFAWTEHDDFLLKKAERYLKQTQRSDGGWADPEETAWAVGVLSKLDDGPREAIEKAERWLEGTRLSKGGWGRHPRDRARIPTTALVITLVPSVASEIDCAWAREEWEKDLAAPVHLSYKGGFYLLTACHDKAPKDYALVDKTIEYLAEDQNDDGGFGPWRDHPIGSDPWSTGVVLWGLSAWIDRVNSEVIEKALNWLEKTQLPSGYWAYHYLDEGTSYALIGAVAAMRALDTKK